MPFKKGDMIKQKVVVAEGPVEDVRYDADTGKFQYLISYENQDGPTQRWFEDTDVEAVVTP